MSDTVIGYVLRRLKDIGIDAIFGVPGDFAFPVQDAIVNDAGIDWIGCCNELNAGYAADGYARLRGAAALSTTYGVGELSAINAIAGSYAENLPVFHLTGMPAMPVQTARSLVHQALVRNWTRRWCRPENMTERPISRSSRISTPLRRWLSACTTASIPSMAPDNGASDHHLEPGSLTPGQSGVSSPQRPICPPHRAHWRPARRARADVDRSAS